MITEEQFNAVCDLIADTRKSRRTICKEIGIAPGGVDEFIKIKGVEAENHYARAKIQQAESILEEIYELEDKCKHEIDFCEDSRKCNSIVQFYKLKVDNLKWMLSKLLPKKYGDKLDLTSDGEKINIPGEFTVKIVDPKKDKNATD